MDKAVTYQQIISEVAKGIDLPEEVVDNTYKAFWLYIRNTISELPLKDIDSVEELNNLKTSFNIPALGKLACTETKFENLKRQFNYLQELYD